MTRKEIIEQKAKIRADQYSHPVEWNECYHHWIEGAEWADRTMLEKASKWIASHLLCPETARYLEEFKKAMEK